MTIRIGNAPCSWGVEFADDPRNPSWQQVLKDCAEAGYRGIELGPIGFMPEDPGVLSDALAEHELSLIGGVVFRPFHDPSRWDEVEDSAIRTARSLHAGSSHRATFHVSVRAAKDMSLRPRVMRCSVMRRFRALTSGQLLSAELGTVSIAWPAVGPCVTTSPPFSLAKILTPCWPSAL